MSKPASNTLPRLLMAAVTTALALIVVLPLTAEATSVTTSQHPPAFTFDATGYLPTGTIYVQVTPATDCNADSFDIAIAPVANSAPDDTTPPPPSSTILHDDVGQGTYSFSGLGWGKYTITVTTTCNHVPVQTHAAIIRTITMQVEPSTTQPGMPLPPPVFIPQFYTFPFGDVPTGAWYYADLVAAHKRGLISGKSAHTFDAMAEVTVAEAVKFAAVMHQINRTGTIKLTNGTNVWYSTYMTYAVQNGILSRDLSSIANDPVSRGMLANIFYYALPPTSYAAKNTVANGAIPDVPMSGPYATSIYSFYRAGILTGSDAARNYLPNDTILRCEAAVILNRMTDANARVSFTMP